MIQEEKNINKTGIAGKKIEKKLGKKWSCLRKNVKEGKK